MDIATAEYLTNAAMKRVQHRATAADELDWILLNVRMTEEQREVLATARLIVFEKL